MSHINQKLHSIVKLAQRLESEPKKFGTDVLLTGTDIHLIEIIGENKKSSVSDIARLAGVTKGAVSQKLQKLERKGIVQTRQDPANLSRYIVSLTSKGKVAFFSHRHWHETMDGGFDDYYKGLDEKKTVVICEFLDQMEDFLIRLLSVKE